MEEALPEWVDGTAFVEWLEERRPGFRKRLTDSQRRWIHRLIDENGRGGLGRVDAICVRLDLHINEIPEEVWTTPPHTGRRPGMSYPPELKAQASAMLRDGAPWKEVANLYGIPGGTVKKWQGDAKRAA